MSRNTDFGFRKVVSRLKQRPYEDQEEYRNYVPCSEMNFKEYGHQAAFSDSTEYGHKLAFSDSADYNHQLAFGDTTEYGHQAAFNYAASAPPSQRAEIPTHKPPSTVRNTSDSDSRDLYSSGSDKYHKQMEYHNHLPKRKIVPIDSNSSNAYLEGCTREVAFSSYPSYKQHSEQFRKRDEWSHGPETMETHEDYVGLSTSHTNKGSGGFSAQLQKTEDYGRQHSAFRYFNSGYGNTDSQITYMGMEEALNSEEGEKKPDDYAFPDPQTKDIDYQLLMLRQFGTSDSQDSMQDKSVEMDLFNNKQMDMNLSEMNRIQDAKSLPAENGFKSCLVTKECEKQTPTGVKSVMTVELRKPKCKYFLKGRCFKGVKCNFKHDNLMIVPDEDEEFRHYENTVLAKKLEEFSSFKCQTCRVCFTTKEGYNVHCETLQHKHRMESQQFIRHIASEQLAPAESLTTCTPPTNYIRERKQFVNESRLKFTEYLKRKELTKSPITLSGMSLADSEEPTAEKILNVLQNPEKDEHGRTKTPCRHFLRGTCALGDECSYSHNFPRFSASVLDEDKRFCGVCDVMLTSRQCYASHIRGRQHFKKLHHKYQTGMPKMNSNVDVMETFRTTQDPCVGLEFITEFVGKKFKRSHFECNLCNCVMDAYNIFSHVIGLKHQMAYFKVRDINLQLNLVSCRLEKSQLRIICRELAKKVEKKEGRQKIKVHLADSAKILTEKEAVEVVTKEWQARNNKAPLMFVLDNDTTTTAPSIRQFNSSTDTLSDKDNVLSRLSPTFLKQLEDEGAAEDCSIEIEELVQDSNDAAPAAKRLKLVSVEELKTMKGEWPSPSAQGGEVMKMESSSHCPDADTMTNSGTSQSFTDTSDKVPPQSTTCTTSSTPSVSSIAMTQLSSDNVQPQRSAVMPQQSNNELPVSSVAMTQASASTDPISMADIMDQPVIPSPSSLSASDIPTPTSTSRWSSSQTNLKQLARSCSKVHEASSVGFTTSAPPSFQYGSSSFSSSGSAMYGLPNPYYPPPNFPMAYPPHNFSVPPPALPGYPLPFVPPLPVEPAQSQVPQLPVAGAEVKTEPGVVDLSEIAKCLETSVIRNEEEFAAVLKISQVLTIALKEFRKQHPY